MLCVHAFVLRPFQVRQSIAGSLHFYRSPRQPLIFKKKLRYLCLQLRVGLLASFGFGLQLFLLSLKAINFQFERLLFFCYLVKLSTKLFSLIAIALTKKFENFSYVHIPACHGGALLCKICFFATVVFGRQFILARIILFFNAKSCMQRSSNNNFHLSAPRDPGTKTARIVPPFIPDHNIAIRIDKNQQRTVYSTAPQTRRSQNSTKQRHPFADLPNSVAQFETLSKQELQDMLIRLREENQNFENKYKPPAQQVAPTSAHKLVKEASDYLSQEDTDLDTSQSLMDKLEQARQEQHEELVQLEQQYKHTRNKREEDEIMIRVVHPDESPSSAKKSPVSKHKLFVGNAKQAFEGIVNKNATRNRPHSAQG